MSEFFRRAVLALAVAVCCAVPALAVDAAPESPDASSPGGLEDSVSLESVSDDKNITVNITMPAAVPTAPETDSVPPVEDVLPPESVSPAYAQTSLDALNRVAGTDMLSTVVETLFGTYTPRTQTITEYLPDGTSVSYQEYVPGVAGMDWPWLAGVGMFSVCLLSFFKLLGGVLKRG